MRKEAGRIQTENQQQRQKQKKPAIKVIEGLKTSNTRIQQVKNSLHSN